MSSHFSRDHFGAIRSLPLWVTLFFFCALSPIWAQQEEPTQPPEKISSQETLAIPEEAAITHHEVSVEGQTISFKATAGRMPLFDTLEHEELGKVFYVAYTVEPLKAGEKRPITFVFNGGPGSPSIWLHMGAFGPFRAPIAKDGLKLPRPPYSPEPNPFTLLDLTDLVFIDPIGTGFSQATNGNGDSPQKRQSFWGVREDVEAVADFIRMYLTRNDRWASPLYVAGESYGGMRAAGLSAWLQDIGIEPSGLILVAPAISYGDLVSDTTNDRAFMHLLPSMAASAHYHGKLSPELQALDVKDLMNRARAWCLKTYLPALWQGNNLSAKDTERIAEQLSQWTGLPVELVRKLNFRIPEWVFAENLLGEKRQFLSLYDGRITAPGGEYRYAEDPLMANLNTPFGSAFNDYLQRTLQYETDLPYSLDGNDAHRNWNWTSGTENTPYGYPNTTIDLATALRRNPFMKVFVAMGDYDLVCPAGSIMYTLDHLDIPSDRKDNILLHSYPAGHMMYVRKSVIETMKKDLSDFYRAPTEP